MYQLSATGTLSALPNLEFASTAFDACFTASGNLVVTFTTGAVEVFSRSGDGSFVAAAQAWQASVSATLRNGACDHRALC